MLISVNWLREFVDLPADLDVAALAERFTMTCAEVEGVERIEVGAAGLIAAKIVSHEDLPGTRDLRRAVLDVGGKTLETVSAAPVLRDGDLVVFAPPGGRTNATGAISVSTVAGRRSEGMILPGDAIGIAMSADEAIFCPPSLSAGEAIDAAMLDDWVIEVDNKSITHRPDLWGHYGVAREIAAMLGVELRPYPVVDLSELQDKQLPLIPIEIDDPARCPRYTGLRIAGVGAQAAPLWMQTRLGHVGMRPIDCLVDLSNYIMAELGQPTHAFDGEKLDRIEVGLAEPGAKFTTLDGVERALPDEALMIQCHRRCVAVAGVMGGLETEVSPRTRTILLESANFEPAGIRRCATALGLRSEASTRFEKSLDPANTVLAIQRFLYLARPEFPGLSVASQLSDCYPSPAETVTVEVDTAFAQRFMGHEVSAEEMTSILTAIGFGVEQGSDQLKVIVPSYRATKDVSIEADVIEEIARYVGYDNIAPALPEVTVRHFPPNAQHRVEQDSLRMFCMGLGYSEVHLYIWHDDAWLKKLGFQPPPGIELRNPASAGQHRLRHTLMTGLLQAADRNRLHTEEFKLCEVGSVFPDSAGSTTQERRLGLVSARRGKRIEDDLLANLKGDLESWSSQALGLPTTFTPWGNAERPDWAHQHKTAGVAIGGDVRGMVSVVPLTLRRAMDEHLSNWGIAWAEIELGPLAVVSVKDVELGSVPEFPEVEMDFSMLVDSALAFGEASRKLTAFDHPLLRRITYVDSYEGQSIPAGKRSLTYRAKVAAGDRTLVEEDLAGFRKSFEAFIAKCGFQLRK